MNTQTQEENKTKTRTFKIQKKDAYAYKNTSCIQSIKVKRHRQVRNLLLSINGVGIMPSKADTNYWYWDFGVIRKQIREYLGDTPYENECMRLETMFTYNQLKAIQHYSLNYTQLSTSIFTNECMLQFVPDNQTVDMLDAEEVVYYSDQQLKTQSSTSTSL